MVIDRIPEVEVTRYVPILVVFEVSKGSALVQERRLASWTSHSKINSGHRSM
jgi:hypothetical protein